MASLQQIQPVLMSRDVEVAVQFYRKLGFEIAFRDGPEPSKYVGMRRDEVELHLQWHDAKEWDFPNDRPTYKFLVDDVDGLSAEFRDRGVSTGITPVQNTSWGTREFHVLDPDRNGLQFYLVR